MVRLVQDMTKPFAALKDTYAQKSSAWASTSGLPRWL